MPGDARARRRRWGDPAPPLLTLALAAILAAAPAQQDTARLVVRVGDVTVVAWPGMEDLAIGLAEEADRPALWPGLGRRTAGPIRLIVVPDGAALAEVTGGRAPAWGAGIAVPGARTIALRADAGDITRTLRHEIAHLVLDGAVAVRRPLWFDEGYAAWAAGEFGRIDALALNFAVVRGRVPDLPSLDRALRGSAGEADAAYALAATAVIELAARNPTNSLEPLLTRLADGIPFDEAVLATTGLTLGRFEIEWRRSVRRRYGLLAWTAAGGLWLVVAVVVLVAARVRRHADAPRREALDIGWELPPEEENDPDDLDPTRGHV